MIMYSKKDVKNVFRKIFCKKVLDCIIELSEDIKLEFLSNLFWITNDYQR